MIGFKFMIVTPFPFQTEELTVSLTSPVYNMSDYAVSKDTCVMVSRVCPR